MFERERENGNAKKITFVKDKKMFDHDGPIVMRLQRMDYMTAVCEALICIGTSLSRHVIYVHYGGRG